MTEATTTRSYASPRALFYSVPGHGHITPSLLLVAEMTRRQHQIVYYASPGFRRAIEGTGATFRPYRIATYPTTISTAANRNGHEP